MVSFVCTRAACLYPVYACLCGVFRMCLSAYFFVSDISKANPDPLFVFVTNRGGRDDKGHI